MFLKKLKSIEERNLFILLKKYYIATITLHIVAMMYYHIFKNKNIFSLVFLVVLIIDIVIKTTQDVCVYRFVSKVSLTVLLLAYYIINHKEVFYIKSFFMISALSFFLIGDVFLILYEVELYYLFGIFCFAIGKLFYVFRFANQRDFKIKNILPVILFCFSFMLIILYLINDNLNNYFFPTLVYLFAVTMFVIFAFLRKGEVSNESYYLVIIGVILSLFADSIAALSSFYNSAIPFQAITIMLFYGVSQLLVVLGVVQGNSPKDVLVES